MTVFSSPQKSPAAVSRIVLSVLSLFAACFAAFASRGATMPDRPEFEVSKPAGSNAMHARFDFHGQVDVNYFFLTGPDRLVIDVTGAVIEDKQVFEIDSAHVYRVRTAQNAPDVVRIVFDLKKEFKPNISISEDKGIVAVSEAASLPFPKVAVKKFNDRVEVTIPFKEAPVFQREKVEDPPRYVLDFQGYAPAEKLAEQAVNAGIFKSVRVSQFSSDPDVTRVVLETALPAEIEIVETSGGKNITAKIYQYSMYGKTVCVDAGHGGKDPGAQVKGLDEKDIILDVALKLRTLLTAAGAKVIMTRKDDTFIPLKERAAIANRGAADVFISIHANALDNHKYKENIRGIQVFHHSDSSRQLAELIRDSLSETEAVGDWGVYAREKLVVLRETHMKAALAELGFMTHSKEVVLLKDNTFRENAARGLLNGLEEFFGGRGPALAALELAPDIVANLPTHPFNYIYDGGGNVLEGDLGDVHSRKLQVPEIPDFIDVLPSYEEGLTHEVGGPSAASGISTPVNGPGN